MHRRRGVEGPVVRLRDLPDDLRRRPLRAGPAVLRPGALRLSEQLPTSFDLQVPRYEIITTMVLAFSYSFQLVLEADRCLKDVM